MFIESEEVMRTVSDSDALRNARKTVLPPPTALAQTKYSAFRGFFRRAEDGGGRKVDRQRLESLKTRPSSAGAEQGLTFQQNYVSRRLTLDQSSRLRFSPEALNY